MPWLIIWSIALLPNPDSLSGSGPRRGGCDSNDSGRNDHLSVVLTKMFERHGNEFHGFGIKHPIQNVPSFLSSRAEPRDLQLHSSGNNLEGNPQLSPLFLRAPPSRVPVDREAGFTGLIGHYFWSTYFWMAAS
jgi:hypothetical protein